METMKHNMNYCLMATRAAVPEDVEETRTLEFVASDNTRDSHGTVLPVDKWDLNRFNANGVITYQHNIYSDDPDDVIGVGAARVQGNELIVRITFEGAEINPRAEKVFRKLLNGTLKGVSVGFIPNTREIGKWGDGEESRSGSNPTFYFNGMELIEVAVVAVPSNKNALRRGFGDDIVRHIHAALDGTKTIEEIQHMSVAEAVRLMGGEDPQAAPKTEHDEMERDTIVDRARLLID